MKKYKVWINMCDMGIYEGIDEEDALERYARDAGYGSWKEAAEGDLKQVRENDGVRLFEWTVVEDCARGHR